MIVLRAALVRATQAPVIGAVSAKAARSSSVRNRSGTDHARTYLVSAKSRS